MADIKELMQVRKDKMQKIKDHGISVRPERYEKTHTIKDARKLADGTCTATRPHPSIRRDIQ